MPLANTSILPEPQEIAIGDENTPPPGRINRSHLGDHGMKFTARSMYLKDLVIYNAYQSIAWIYFNDSNNTASSVKIFFSI